MTRLTDASKEADAERASALNGAWIPSMAEEVATERSTLRWRCLGSRR